MSQCVNQVKCDKPGVYRGLNGRDNVTKWAKESDKTGGNSRQHDESGISRCDQAGARPYIGSETCDFLKCDQTGRCFDLQGYGWSG